MTWLGIRPKLARDFELLLENGVKDSPSFARRRTTFFDIRRCGDMLGRDPSCLSVGEMSDDIEVERELFL
jgi:hypothetical protein